MSWLADNAGSLYIVFGIAAAAFVVIWWLNDRRVKFLGYAVGMLALIGVVWLLANAVITDSRQLELNVHAMAEAVERGKVDDLFQHIANDFRYHEMGRDELYQKSQAAIRAGRVREIKITQFNVEEVSREKKFAKTSFRVSVWADDQEGPFPFITHGDFILEGNQWKLKTIRFYKFLGDKDQEFRFPGI